MSSKPPMLKPHGAMCNDNILQAFKPNARETDIYVVTEPKCGQTWLTNFIYHLKTKGSSVDFEGKTIFGVVPWLELPIDLAGVFKPYDVNERIAFFETLDDPRIFKMHVRWDKIPNNATKSKIITITRDPRDLPYSMYRHCTSMITTKDENVKPFEEFFEEWVDTFDLIPWMKSFWPHKDAENVLWLRYEDMTYNLKDTGRRIIEFLGFDVSEEELDKACELSTFDHMQKHEKTHIYNGEKTVIRKNSSFIREGKVGANRGRLTEDMEKRLMDKLMNSGLPKDAIDWLLSIPN